MSQNPTEKRKRASKLDPKLIRVGDRVRVNALRASQRAPLPAWVREVRAAVRALLCSEVVDA